MSTRGFSRRDLLQLGGKLVMTVGAAKVVVALPGCGGDDGVDPVDAPPADACTYDCYSYTLDDCHGVGTYDHPVVYPAYTYHYYFQDGYGCPYYLTYPQAGLYCYYEPNFVPGYDYFCFSSYYQTTSMP
jgi:hypothetical protein